MNNAVPHTQDERVCLDHLSLTVQLDVPFLLVHGRQLRKQAEGVETHGEIVGSETSKHFLDISTNGRSFYQLVHIYTNITKNSHLCKMEHKIQSKADYLQTE